MKTAFKWFDIFLNFLLAAPVVFVALAYFIILEQTQNENFLQIVPFHENIGAVLGTVITFTLLLSVLFSVIYFISGIIFVIFGMRKNEKVAFSVGRKLLIKGLVRGVSAFLFFFILSLALSFFGISGPDMSMPKKPVDPDNHFHGFPVKDLEIINIQAAQPKNPKNWACSITVHNSNSTMAAYNILFGLDYSSYSSDVEDTIRPGQTRVINIESYYTKYIQNPCATKIFVQNAGIAKK